MIHPELWGWSASTPTPHVWGWVDNEEGVTKAAKAVRQAWIAKSVMEE